MYQKWYTISMSKGKWIKLTVLVLAAGAGAAAASGLLPAEVSNVLTAIAGLLNGVTS